MKIIFLDVDGVLNSSRSELAKCRCFNVQAYQALCVTFNEVHSAELPWEVERTFETIDPVAVALINRLIQKSEAKVVLSTSHRTLFSEHPDLIYRRLLDLYFKAIGLEAPIFDLTPVMHVERCIEVKNWQDKYPEVTHHVVLDDAERFWKDQNFVKCDPHVGFSYQNYLDCCSYLEVLESPIIC